jgi:hypothetical protein
MDLSEALRTRGRTEFMDMMIAEMRALGERVAALEAKRQAPPSIDRTNPQDALNTGALDTPTPTNAAKARHDVPPTKGRRR